MNFIKHYFRRHPIRTRRFLEILPGVFSWSLILFPVWGSFIVPRFVAYFVVAFAVYWLYRSVTLAVLAVVAHLRIRTASSFNWALDIKNQFPHTNHSVHHLIIIPTYKEPLSTLNRTLKTLSEQSISKKQLHIMLSFEEREGPDAYQKSERLLNDYKNTFGHLWSTFHPDIKGEIKGKSSNTSWGAQQAKKILVDIEKMDIEKITITSEDADARFHHHYFSCLTSKFLSTPKPDRFNKVWQGGIVFYNNIWEVPAPVRVLASIFSVTQLYILVRKDRLVNFSTYSTSLKHVDDIGYWDTDVIPEDYRLFFKSYFAKKGKFEAEPIYLPIYADAAQSDGFWSTMKNQYEQLKRWAWGVSDDAYIIRQYVLSDGIPFWDKTVRVFKVIEDHFLWPVNWFAVTIAAMLPPLLNENFGRTILGSRLPQTTSFLLTLSLVSMVVIFILDAINRPPRPKKGRIISILLQPLEFLMLPVIGFFFSALPGLDAHTRLLFGKYIEYKVTEKV